MKPILLVSERNNGAQCDPVVRHIEVSEAAERFVIYEVGYGGHVTAVGERMVEQGLEHYVSIRTVVLGCVDVTTFSGKPDHMRYLVALAGMSAHLDASPAIHNALIEKVMPEVTELTGGNPLKLSLVAGLCIGKPKKRLLPILASGASESDMLKMASLSIRIEDLLVISRGMFNKEYTLDEGLSMLQHEEMK